MKLIVGFLAIATASSACAWDAEGKQWLCSWTEPAPEGVLRCGPPLVPLVSDKGAPYCGQAQGCKAEKTRDTAWKVSAAVVATGVGLDIASSWRQPEATWLYRSPDGQFGSRGLAIRAGMAAGTLAVQWLVMRTHPPTWVVRTFTVVNFISGARSINVARKNWQQ